VLKMAEWSRGKQRLIHLKNGFKGAMFKERGRALAVDETDVLQKRASKKS
jgi:hypothetical protein